MDSDVIIIGAGVIGCAIAYNLSKADLTTLVIDKADGVGREVSWAGAGVLTSHASTREPYPELCRASLALYPSLADELKARTQIDIEFIRSGTLSLFFNEDEENGVIGLAERRIDRGFSAEVLTPEQIWKIEPAVSKSVVGGVRFPEDAQVRNPKLVRAFAKGAALLGSQFLLGNPVDGFEREKGRISGVKVNGELFRGDTIVIAARLLVWRSRSRTRFSSPNSAVARTDCARGHHISSVETHNRRSRGLRCSSIRRQDSDWRDGRVRRVRQANNVGRRTADD